MDNLFPVFDFSVRRAELEAELDEVASGLPALRAAATTAKEAAEAAEHRWANLVKRANAATRHGADEASPSLLALLEGERLTLRRVQGAATRARLALENALWRSACLSEDLDQLDKLENPPKAGGPLYEIAKRPLPTPIDDFEVIRLPTRAA